MTRPSEYTDEHTEAGMPEEARPGREDAAATSAVDNPDATGAEAPVTEEGEFAARTDEADGEDAATVLEQQLEAERERAEGYLEELRRERASFINYRRRTEQEKDAWAREANAALIHNLLAVLDDFERARDAVPEDRRHEPWVEGLTLVERKLRSTLELAGLRPIEAEGGWFDPALHEAVATEESAEHEPGRVLEEYRKGYKLGDQLLRPSLVKVSRTSDHGEEPHDDTQEGRC